ANGCPDGSDLHDSMLQIFEGNAALQAYEPWRSLELLLEALRLNHSARLWRLQPPEGNIFGCSDANPSAGQKLRQSNHPRTLLTRLPRNRHLNCLAKLLALHQGNRASD